MAKGRLNRKGSAIALIIIGVIYIILRSCGYLNSPRQSDKRGKSFRYLEVYYTKHAMCRMDCRHIDSAEVREILSEGKINYSKSDLKARPCAKYALEGITHDKQRVRIIVGDCESRPSIITVIDLENEYDCDCPGNEQN